MKELLLTSKSWAWILFALRRKFRTNSAKCIGPLYSNAVLELNMKVRPTNLTIPASLWNVDSNKSNTPLFD